MIAYAIVKKGTTDIKLAYSFSRGMGDIHYIFTSFDYAKLFLKGLGEEAEYEVLPFVLFHTE